MPAFVDDDHGVGNSVENRFQMRLARVGIFGACRRREARAAQQFAAP